jgi:hypothetical protein
MADRCSEFGSLIGAPLNQTPRPRAPTLVRAVADWVLDGGVSRP